MGGTTIPISTAAEDAPQGGSLGHGPANGVEHVFEGIGRVRIIDDDGGAIVEGELLEAARHRRSLGEGVEDSVAVVAERPRRAVGRRQVVGIKSTHEPKRAFATVEAEP